MNYFRASFLIFFVIIFSADSNAHSCLINVPLSELKIPIFERYFGSIKLKIPKSISRTIILGDGEKITGYCATKFEKLQYQKMYNYDENEQYERQYENLPFWEMRNYTVDDASTVDFECQNGRISFSTGEIVAEDLTGDFVQCNDLKWNAYEVKKQFDWCSAKANSYVLAMDIGDRKIKMAAVCFNLQDLVLESIRYKITGNADVSQNSDILGLEEIESALLGIKIENFVSIMQKDATKQAIDQDRLLNAAVYVLDFVIQNRVFGNFLNEYGDFLKVSWWHNLLHGNWKRFTTALSKQTAIKDYDVFTGVSGGIMEPRFHTCLENEIHETKSPKFVQHNDSLPAYIWTYLKGRNHSENFVVIGYNSPFFQFFDPKEIVFCKDICDDIPWLENVSSTFSYSALGVMFCCTPEDVRNSRVLNGFPYELEITSPSTTTAIENSLEDSDYQTEI